MANTIIYTKAGCPTCNKAKQYYERHNIAFEERDVYRKKEWREIATRLSPNATVPVIVEQMPDGSETVSVGWHGREG